MEAGKQNLPKRIYHLAHPEPDELVLCRYHMVRSNFRELRSNCSICFSKFEVGEYIYACSGLCSLNSCDFKVDIACSSLKAGVKFCDHRDLLFFLERVDPSHSQTCYSCHGYFHELMFRCVKNAHCSYSLHLSCGPLPIAIPYTHGGHDFTLTLKDAFIDGFDPEDCWCDICEEQRDPMKSVYRSEDPPFTATIDCLLPQIVGALRGDLGEVKLRSVRKHIPGVVLATAQGSTKQELGEEVSTLDGGAEEVIGRRKIQNNAADLENNVDISSHGEEFIVSDDKRVLDLIPQEEKEFIKHAFAEFHRRFVKDIKSIPYRYSDPAFEQFKELSITGASNSSSWMSTPYLGGNLRFVKVGDNLVPWELVPLCVQVIDKQGDFTVDSRLSPFGKEIIMTTLLMLIQETMGLQIREVTDDLLVMLQFHLEFINENFGFDVQSVRTGQRGAAGACLLCTQICKG